MEKAKNGGTYTSLAYVIDTIQKNGRLIPTAKRGKEINRSEIKTSTIYLPDNSV